MRKLAILVALVAVFAMTNAAWSASVELTLSINTVAKTWSLTATDSVTDPNNYGIASFALKVNNISSVSNDSPLMTLTSGKTYGFGFTRSGTIPTNNINASQQLSDSNYTIDDMAWGVGQTAGNLADLLKGGETAGSPTVHPGYGVPVLLASGAYTGSTPTWGATSVNIFKTNHANRATRAASISTKIVKFPEPATLALLSVGGALLGLRRRRA